MTDHRALEHRRLGRTGLDVTTLTFGSAPLATVFWNNDEATAVAAAEAARDAGIALFDTSPFYGLGEAEERVGAALRGHDGPLVATKVGRTLSGSGENRQVEFDFSAEAVRRQLDASRERLGRERIDIVHVHDPEEHLDQALAECVPALNEMRERGTITAVSVGTIVCDTVLRFLTEARPDVVMLAGRLTLLDRHATDEVLPACREHDVPLLAAGVFNSGVLAQPEAGRWFDYAPADDATLERARRLHELCARFDVPLRAAAMAFPLRFDEVASIVVGMAEAAEVADNIAALDTPIPDELWHELGA